MQLKILLKIGCPTLGQFTDAAIRIKAVFLLPFYFGDQSEKKWAESRANEPIKRRIFNCN